MSSQLEPVNTTTTTDPGRGPALNSTMLSLAGLCAENGSMTALSGPLTCGHCTDNNSPQNPERKRERFRTRPLYSMRRESETS